MAKNYFIVENFLKLKEHSALLEYTFECAEQKLFQSSTVIGDSSHRSSQVVFNLGKFSVLFAEQVLAILPKVQETLNIAPFPISTIESQLTAHNDGDYFKAHCDNNHLDIASRVLTYVYYFFLEPKSFNGGELVINADGSNQIIEPVNNTCIFFSSNTLHEVLPVRCPSGKFQDGRFTVNGWIRSLELEVNA